jgi:(4-(4-[2-(gamma-L-glutamylamino)ethyl]phenoxymethyl)furan-2-yl)methanamine synthase
MICMLKFPVPGSQFPMPVLGSGLRVLSSGSPREIAELGERAREPATANAETGTRRAWNTDPTTMNPETGTGTRNVVRAVVGWDIGGVNTKAALVRDGRVVDVELRPFELQRDPEALAPLIREIAVRLRADAATVHAVTMTAELSQMFRTKCEGVAFVLNAMQEAVPSHRIVVFGVDGQFRSVTAACEAPLVVAASNWAATAWQVAAMRPDALLVDIGSTTTDIIPIVGGCVVAQGKTDPERLASGELVYTGAVRSPVESIVSEVPFRGATAGVSAEAFALAGDVHVWRGDLPASAYAVPAPDGRPIERTFVAERLARVICADREMLGDDDVAAIAAAVAEAQVDRVAAALARVHVRHPSTRTVLTAGVGAFLAAAAARACGLAVESLADSLGRAASTCAPAAAVALLLDRAPRARDLVDPPAAAGSPRTVASKGARRRPDVVVKVGGGMLSDVSAARRVMATLDALEESSMLVVPGGGPFADAVRDLDRQFGLDMEVAHWMAIAGMEQYGQLLASTMRRGVLIEDAAAIQRALEERKVPILLPSRWLRRADPVPHTWDVTSDSIAAWVAGVTGASRLVLVKPPGASGGGLTDAFFRRALPEGVTPVVVPADRLDDLRRALTTDAEC